MATPAHGYSLSSELSPRATSCKSQPWGLRTCLLIRLSLNPIVWQHVAVAHKKGQSITYFINGVEEEPELIPEGPTSPTTNKVLYIGAEWDGGLALYRIDRSHQNQ